MVILPPNIQAFMLRRVPVFLAIMMTQLGLYGQEFALQDVVSLHNGSVIRGKIIEHRLGDSLWIQTLDMTVFALATQDIERIDRAYAPYRKLLLVYPSGQEALSKHPLSRWYQAIHFVNGIKEGRFGPNLETQLHVSWGYRMHRLAQIGIGSGMNIYSQALILPTFVQIESVVLPQHISPIIQVKAGYGWIGNPFQAYNEIRGGLFGQALVGVWRINKYRRKSAFSIGYSFQRIFEDYTTTTEGGFDPITNEFIPGVPVQIRGIRILQSIPFQYTWYF